MAKLTVTKRKQAVASVHAGQSKVRSARSVGTQPRTVGRWVGRAEAGELLSDKPRSGRPCKLNDKNLKYIRALARKGSTCKDIVQKLAEFHGVQVCANTVANALKGGRCPMKYAPVKKRKIISKANISKRLEFCRTHLDSNMEDVVCIDASLFRYDFTSGKCMRMAWQYVDTPLEMDVGGRSSYACVYGAVSLYGYSPLVIACEASRKAVVPNSEDFQGAMISITRWANRLLGKGKWKLLMDNATCHTSRSSTQWLQVHGVEVLPGYPPSSSDLNLIENCWAVLGKSMEKKSIHNFDQFKRELVHAWDCMDMNMPLQLWHSWPKRMQAIIDGGGKLLKGY